VQDCAALQRCDGGAGADGNSTNNGGSNSTQQQEVEEEGGGGGGLFCFCTADAEGREFCANERLCFQAKPCETSRDCPGAQRCIPRTCCPAQGEEEGASAACGCPCGVCGIGTGGGGLAVAQGQVLPPSLGDVVCVPTMFGGCA
jgi:hypothetical protein